MLNTKAHFKTRHQLPDTARDAMVKLLNQQLANTFDLYSQTKQAHWNVKGRDFIQLHKLFDELAENILEYVDSIAERATALGGYAVGDIRSAAQMTQTPELPTDVVDGMDVVELLAERYAWFSNVMHKAIAQAEDHDDPATADLFTEILRNIDKDLYFLEAHLQS